MSIQLYPGIAFSPQAMLADNIGAADTIIRVTDVSAFPPAPNLATIGTDEEGETILYAAKTADALSGCARGVEGNARQWSAGETIGRNFTAKDHADLIAALSTKQATLTGAPGQVVGFDATGAALPVRRWSNHNLLDDAYFLYPINQLGVSGTITAPGYFIDRWKLVSGSVTITAGGLVLNGTIVQILEQSIGEETIASVLTTEGVTAAAYDDESRTFAITASGQTLIAAKLELGSIQTVAYQNADGSLVLNDPPPKKALELAQCQRYYEDLGWVTMIITGTTLDVTVPFKVPKRSIPTSTCYSANNVSGKISYYTGSVWADHDASLEIAGPRLPINGQRIRATGLPNNAIARFRIVSDANL